MKSNLYSYITITLVMKCKDVQLESNLMYLNVPGEESTRFAKLT